MHKHLKRTVVDWALVYEWKGTDSSLKPVFLTAHQDVVPVLDSTVNQWTHPPFEGVYDGTKIWGACPTAISADQQVEALATRRAVSSPS